MRLPRPWGVATNHSDPSVCDLTAGMFGVAFHLEAEDAFLLAAAPELLAACEDAVRLLEWDKVDNVSVFRTLRAAIQKARGEEPE